MPRCFARCYGLICRHLRLVACACLDVLVLPDSWFVTTVYAANTARCVYLCQLVGAALPSLPDCRRLPADVAAHPLDYVPLPGSVHGRTTTRWLRLYAVTLRLLVVPDDTGRRLYAVRYGRTPRTAYRTDCWLTTGCLPHCLVHVGIPATLHGRDGSHTAVPLRLHCVYRCRLATLVCFTLVYPVYIPADPLVLPRIGSAFITTVVLQFCQTRTQRCLPLPVPTAHS